MKKSVMDRQTRTKQYTCLKLCVTFVQTFTDLCNITALKSYYGFSNTGFEMKLA